MPTYHHSYINMSLLKVGILGGGQLGRMLLQAAANYPVITHVLENDAEAPAACLCHHFTLGDIKNYDNVYSFGKKLDAITIEIENVNIEALEALEKEGVAVFPKPSVLRTIKSKILQKAYYTQLQIPTPAYFVTENLTDLEKHAGFLPAVHKLSEGGYDGRGVQVIKTAADISAGFDAPAVLEKMVQIQKEIAIMVAVGQDGKTTLFPAVEMVVDKYLNQLDYQLCPAELQQKTLWKAEAIARAVVTHFNSPGLFAVELLIDNDNEVWVNETAPRVHNSGHHGIEAQYCGQFDMLWRIILNYPLGNTQNILPSVMVNLVGENDFKGDVVYEGLEDILKIENAFVHIYGKATTKPGRKMGHVTVISNIKQELLHQANRIKHNLKVKGAERL